MRIHQITDDWVDYFLRAQQNLELVIAHVFQISMHYESIPFLYLQVKISERIYEDAWSVFGSFTQLLFELFNHSLYLLLFLKVLQHLETSTSLGMISLCTTVKVRGKLFDKSSLQRVQNLFLLVLFLQRRFVILDMIGKHLPLSLFILLLLNLYFLTGQFQINLNFITQLVFYFDESSLVVWVFLFCRDKWIFLHHFLPLVHKLIVEMTMIFSHLSLKLKFLSFQVPQAFSYVCHALVQNRKVKVGIATVLHLCYQ